MGCEMWLLLWPAGRAEGREAGRRLKKIWCLLCEPGRNAEGRVGEQLPRTPEIQITHAFIPFLKLF